MTGFTICTKNYLAHARTLADSFLKFHPEGKFYVLLLDKVDSRFNPRKEKFITVPLQKLKNITHTKEFLFKYDVVALNTAIKPFFVEYLFDLGFKKLFYFDTDIVVFSRLTSAIKLLESHNILLTPHILTPVPDDSKIPSEKTFLMAGSYNLGFIGLARSTETMRFISWWKTKTYDGAVSAIANGLFHDQKPIDLVPSLFEKVFILKDPGYNVAYWNLHERNIFTKRGPDYYVNGKRIVFFHYSGFLPRRPWDISLHQTRFEFSDFGPVFRELFQDYISLLEKNGYAVSSKWPYSYGRFNNRVEITDDMRQQYWSLHEARKAFGNPFFAKGSSSFYHTYAQKDKKAFVTHPTYWSLKNNALVKKMIFSLKTLLGKDSYNQISLAFMGLFLPKYVGLTPPTIAAPTLPTAKQIAKSKGINLFCHLTMNTGIGEAGRFFAHLLKDTPIPSTTVDIGGWNEEVRTPQWHHRKTPLFPISLFITNASGVQMFMRDKLGPRSFQNKYNIAYFHWELSQVPPEFKFSFRDISEIWVASSFCQEAFAKFSSVPVVKMPWCPIIPEKRTFLRPDFGFKDSDFIFLTIYDGSHYPERKNPLGLIYAFQKAKLPANAQLIIKVMDPQVKSQYHQRLTKAVAKHRNIKLWTGSWHRNRILDLIAACDCYISLHRSEGFGATIFEAMALGKPTIATGYSGNMDFMTPFNSFPINFRLVEIEKTIGPYKKGGIWAEPDLEHATEMMNFVFNHQAKSKHIGAKARADLMENYNPELLKKELADRLATIQEKFLSQP